MSSTISSGPKKIVRKSAYIQSYAQRLQKVLTVHLDFSILMRSVMKVDEIMQHIFQNDIRLRYQPIDEKIYVLLALQKALNENFSQVHEGFNVEDSELLKVCDGWDLRRDCPGIPSIDFCNRWFEVKDQRLQEIENVLVEMSGGQSE